jgi:hypothetical protein
VLRAPQQSGFRLYGSGGAAALLGIDAGTLAARLKKLDISLVDLKRSRSGVDVEPGDREAGERTDTAGWPT